MVGNQMSLLAREGSRATRIPASLAVYRVGGDGKLNFIRKYDVESGGGKTLMWVGLVALP